jgi:hypothetical protein
LRPDAEHDTEYNPRTRTLQTAATRRPGSVYTHRMSTFVRDCR